MTGIDPVRGDPRITYGRSENGTVTPFEPIVQPVIDRLRLRLAEDQAAALIRAIEGYLDNPGCNARSKQTAMEKLRFAAKSAELALRSAQV